MEIDWERFKQVVDEKLENRLKSITSKLDEQDKLISDLTNTLQSLIDLAKPKANKLNLKPLSKPGPVRKENAKKLESEGSCEDKPAELTKDNSEEHKELNAEES